VIGILNICDLNVLYLLNGCKSNIKSVFDLFVSQSNNMIKRFSNIILWTVFFSLFLSISNSAQVNLPASNPDRIILNLRQDAENSVAVTWRTSTHITEGFCQLQFLSDAPVNIEAGETYKAKTKTMKYVHGNEPVISSNHHSYVFTGLKEGTNYMYRVGTEGNWSEWLEFSTANNDNKVSFIYFGDPQNDIKSQWSRIVRKAYRNYPDCDFMLYAGDIINTAGSDLQWDEWFKAGSFIYGSVPQILTPGNHDYDELVLDPHWNAQFTQESNGPKGLEGTCFFVDYENLKIISFDSAAEGELEDENGYALLSQKAWLDSVLTANTREWVILTTHLPFYSPKESRDNKLLRKHFQPIIEKHGVDMVLTGHDHSYGRGMASDNPDVKPSVVYVVSVSGPKLYEAGNKKWMQQKGSQMQFFQNISINKNQLKYQAYTASGKLFDSFLLKKRKNGTNKMIDQKSNIN